MPASSKKQMQRNLARGSSCVVSWRLRLAAACWSIAATTAAVEAQDPLVIPRITPRGGSALRMAAPDSEAALEWVPPARPAAPPATTGAPQTERTTGRSLPQQIMAMPAVSENLDVIQHRSQLLVTRGKVSRTAVADPSVVEVVQYSPTELSIIGLELGTTTLTLWFDNAAEPLIYLVSTVRDPAIDERRRLDFGKLERKLAVLFPESKVVLIPFSGKVVVKGQARDADEAANILQIVRGEVATHSLEQAPVKGADSASAQTQQRGSAADVAASTVVNMLSVPGEFQVMLRVRIAELDRTQLRRVGGHMTNLLCDPRQVRRYHAGGSNVAGIFENAEISAAINALAANGTAKILSEPVLTVVSGHSASFLSGGEFAVPTIVGVEGVGAQQTTFHGFGTSLKVTPVVLDRDLIRMVIAPEFSQLNAKNTVNGIPGVNTRRAQTTVQLREGQTIALAGLISHQSSAQVSRIPGLGDIPVLGPRLFASKRALQDETELLILVTPEIVRPMDSDDVPAVPGQDVTHPTDCELYKHAMTEGMPEMGNGPIPSGACGPLGGAPIGDRMESAGSPARELPAVASDTGWRTETVRPVPLSANSNRPSGIVNGRRKILSAPVVENRRIQQVSAPDAEFQDPDADPASARTNWSQRPFRSFSRPQSASQQPSASDDEFSRPKSQRTTPAWSDREVP